MLPEVGQIWEYRSDLGTDWELSGFLINWTHFDWCLEKSSCILIIEDIDEAGIGVRFLKDRVNNYDLGMIYSFDSGYFEEDEGDSFRFVLPKYEQNIESGLYCVKCRGFHPYSEANMRHGKLECWACRNGF